MFIGLILLLCCCRLALNSLFDKLIINVRGAMPDGSIVAIKELKSGGYESLSEKTTLFLEFRQEACIMR